MTQEVDGHNYPNILKTFWLFGSSYSVIHWWMTGRYSSSSLAATSESKIERKEKPTSVELRKRGKPVPLHALWLPSRVHTQTQKRRDVFRGFTFKHIRNKKLTEKKYEESNETVCWLLLLLLLGELIYFLWGLINRNFPSSVQLFLLSTTTTDPVQCNSRQREKKKKRGAWHKCVIFLLLL